MRGVDLYPYVRGSRGTPPPISLEVSEARSALARVLATDLPALEEAIETRDFDEALMRAARVRGTRTQIRGLLAGGDQIGVLRADWTRVEPRIDAALVQSPRPNGERDRATAVTQWTARLARGTGSPRAATKPPATPHAAQPRGKRNSSRGRARSTSANMAAAARSIGLEVYYPPSSGGAGSASDFSDDPPTKRVRKKT